MHKEQKNQMREGRKKIMKEETNWVKVLMELEAIEELMQINNKENKKETENENDKEEER